MKILLLIFGIILPILNFAQIDTTQVIKINNIEQFIWIKSQNPEKPILLFLHGGPGRSVMNVAESFNDQLIKNFIVVHWDQRETNKTLGLNSSDQPLSMELLQSDTYEVIKYLLKKFNKKKLFLVSHSWSSFLGFYIADKYPELLHAYIPISPIVDQTESTRLTIKMLKKWAMKNNNQVALEELNAINVPLLTKDDLFYQQKWLFIHNGVDFASKANFRPIYFEWMDVWFPLLIKSFQINQFEALRKVNCPIYFMEGNGDKQKSHWLTKKYFKQLDAETKEFYWFKKSGHTIFNTEPEKLQSTIIEISKLQTME